MCIVNVPVLEIGTEKSEISGKFPFQCFLVDVQFGDKIPVVIVLDDGIVVHETEGGPVVGICPSSAECQMVVLDFSGSGNEFLEIRIVSPVIRIQPKSLGCGYVFPPVQHFHLLVHGFHPEVAVVGDFKTFSRPLLGLYLDDSGRSSGTVQSCLRGVLEDGEAFDICRVDGSQCLHSGSDTVYNDQRSVTSGYGSGSPDADAVQHGDPV